MQTLNPKILLLNHIDKADKIKNTDFHKIMRKEISDALEVTSPMTEAYHVKLSPTSSYFDSSFDDLSFDIKTNKLLCVKTYEFSIPYSVKMPQMLTPMIFYKSITVSFQRVYSDFSTSDVDLTWLFQNPKLLAKIQKYKAQNLPDMIKTYMML